MPDSHRTTATRFQTEREDLALALNLAVDFDLHEGIDNHFSLAVDDTGTRFLINPYGKHRAELGPADLHLVDEHGAFLEQGGGSLDATAFHIHARVHKGLPSAKCVLHTHMPYATALTSVEDMRVRTIGQNACRFHDRVAYDPLYSGLVWDDAEGDRIMAAMGDKPIMMMAYHGVMVTGPTVAIAFERLYFFERVCRNQVLALSTGLPLRDVEEKIAVHTRDQMDEIEPEAAQTHFEALRRTSRTKV